MLTRYDIPVIIANTADNSKLVLTFLAAKNSYRHTLIKIIEQDFSAIELLVN